VVVGPGEPPGWIRVRVTGSGQERARAVQCGDDFIPERLVKFLPRITFISGGPNQQTGMVSKPFDRVSGVVQKNVPFQGPVSRAFPERSLAVARDPKVVPHQQTQPVTGLEEFSAGSYASSPDPDHVEVCFFRQAQFMEELLCIAFEHHLRNPGAAFQKNLPSVHKKITANPASQLSRLAANFSNAEDAPFPVGDFSSKIKGKFNLI